MVDFSLSRDNTCGGFTMSDWSKRTVEGIKERQSTASQKAITIAEQRRLREEQGPTLWQELRNAVQVSIADVNADLTSPAFTYNNISTIQFSVTRHGKAIGDQLHAEFAVSSGPSLLWHYQGRSDASGNCILAIDDDGRVYLQFKNEGISPLKLAEKMLDGLT
jgi:hypothetical protein